MIVLVANLRIYLKPWESLCTYKSLGGCNCAPCAERDFPQGTQNFFTTKFAAQQLLFSSLPCCVFFFFFFLQVWLESASETGGEPIYGHRPDGKHSWRRRTSWFQNFAVLVNTRGRSASFNKKSWILKPGLCCQVIVFPPTSTLVRRISVQWAHSVLTSLYFKLLN